MGQEQHAKVKFVKNLQLEPKLDITFTKKNYELGVEIFEQYERKEGYSMKIEGGG